MKLRMVAVWLLMLATAGCARHTLSGTYTAHGPHWAAMLELTEGADHRLMGSVSSVQLTPDGDLQRYDLNVTDGTVDADGDSVVLTMKAAGLLSEAHNATGRITGAGLDLDLPTGTLHLVRGTPADFGRASLALDQLGHKEQADHAQRKRAEAGAQRVAELTQQLASYTERINRNTITPDDVRHQEEQLVAAARKDLAIERSLTARHQDYAAGQAQFRIGQLSFQFGQIKLQVGQAVQQGQDHLAAFDQALATSPCRGSTPPTGCPALAGEEARYALTRSTVQAHLSQLQEDLRANESAMDQVMKAAGN